MSQWKVSVKFPMENIPAANLPLPHGKISLAIATAFKISRNISMFIIKFVKRNQIIRILNKNSGKFPLLRLG